MSRAVALVSLLFAACTDVDYGPEPSDPTTPVAIEMLGVDGAPAVVATGGAQRVVIPDRGSVGWSAEASDGFSVEPIDGGRWPNLRVAEYRVRADAAGSGGFVIHTNRGLAAGNLDSAPVATVELRPRGYALAGAAFALDGSRRDVQAVLLDEHGRRLVDATVALTDSIAPGTAAGWDALTLAGAAGRHAVAVAGDSFAAQTFAVDVAPSFDRIETVEVGDVTCRHAYAGALEIVTEQTVAAAPLPGAANCWR